ncbi:alpha/beta hydrolase domain-containing protein [Aeromonas veronii]
MKNSDQLNSASVPRSAFPTRFLRHTLFALACTTMAATINAAPGSMLESPAAELAPAIGTAMSATPMPLKASGYVEEEFFIHGKANRYRIANSLEDAQLIDAGHPYVTRALVRRPVAYSGRS